MTGLQTITHIGVEYGADASQKRSILLSNIVSLIIFCLGTLLFSTYYLWYGWNFVTAAIPVITILSLTTLVFNFFNYSTISRVYLSLIVPLSALGISVYSKGLYYDTQEELDYFTFRFFMLVSCIFPLIFFTLKERKLLFATSAVTLLILLLHDPVHTFFGVPFPDRTMKDSNYSFTNVVIFITYLVMVGAVAFLKKTSEESEAKATRLINELNDANEDLKEKHTEIEAQHQEIAAQAENLNISQQKLQGAYKLIQEQKELLLSQNRTLSGELLEMNQDLSATNNELIKHNNELRQFSYTVSHNLRGPVASLSGLISLIDARSLNEEQASIFGHIKTSIQKLEAIIKDLSKIIDIRHDIFSIRQQIPLQTEIEAILHEFNKEIQKHGIDISIDVNDCPVIYSVKPMIHSILYNLITNAIKYRAQDRPHKIHISAKAEGDFIVLRVKDNGLGIDLKNHRDNLFKLYKRFHFHTEGKGIGLYLVKLQAEALGGYVEVASERNVNTEFRVYLAKPRDIEKQVLYDEPHARIFYDARINACGVTWHGPLSSLEYRHVFNKCVEFVKAYNTPNYISDLRQQGYVSREDQQWMFRTIVPEAARYGLKRIAGVIDQKAVDPQVDEYYKAIRVHLINSGIEQRFFNDFDEAIEWLGHSDHPVHLTFPKHDRETHPTG